MSAVPPLPPCHSSNEKLLRPSAITAGVHAGLCCALQRLHPQGRPKAYLAGTGTGTTNPNKP